MTKKQAPSRRPRQAGRKAAPARRADTPKRRVIARRGRVTVSEVEELEELRRELERTARSPLRWNADPDDVQRSVAQLVLTLVEFIRRLLERQAIRRMEAGTFSEAQTENVGRALMQLEAAVHEMAARFGVAPEDLNMDLGPAGKLM